MVSRRGATLLEMLVVLSIFVVVLGVILGIQVYSTKVSVRQTRLSENYRRMMQMLDQVETMLAGAQVWSVTGSELIFSSPVTDLPLTQRFPIFDKEATSLDVVNLKIPRGDVDKELQGRHGSQAWVVMELKKLESLQFSGGSGGRVITVTVSGYPQTELGSRSDPLKLDRNIFVESPF